MKGRPKVSIFQKVEEIRQRLKTVIPEVDSTRLLPMLSHCRRHYEGKLYYGRRDHPDNRVRELTQAERIIYDYMLRSDLNPSTAYRWFIATRVPLDIKEKLERGLISQKKAMEISANRRKVKHSNLGLLMMEELRTLIGGL
ncbi:hypothetical protein J4419_05130 [Candidatus Woesearchaeota archaeon]|nr:hypothetical protein [Candidatus Woesearchaeota archaeon]